jgi:hypothetical protein
METFVLAWFSDRAGPLTTRDNAANDVACRRYEGVGSPNKWHFAAQ